MPVPAPPQACTPSHSTRWSLVRELSAGHADSRAQLYELCVRYWAPIHDYVRRCGHDEAAAHALSREFFEHLQRDALPRASQHRRFRDFLHGELDAFLARKAGGAAGARAPGPTGRASSDDTLRRDFALEVIGYSIARLRAEAADADRLPMFERLERYLSAEARPADIEREAHALGAKPLFVTMAIRRLRQRFRRIVDDELARLVTDHDELVDERAAMLGVLGLA
jgi:hypothetical protein